MAKKLGYGEKAVTAMELLNNTNKTDHQIAYAVGCHVSYVKALRRKMAHRAEEPRKPIGTMERKIPGGPATVVRATQEDRIEKILDERGSRYGAFISHAMITQMLKGTMNTYLTQHNKTLMPDQQEALDMIFHKIGRILNGDPNYADSWIDIAGYAKLVADRLEGKIR